MIRVIFVVSQNNKLNIIQDPLSLGDNFMQWVASIDPSYFSIHNSKSSHQVLEIKKFQRIGFSIISLGDAASKNLKKLRVPHLNLPLPKKCANVNITEQLKVAHKYVRGFYERTY